MCATAVHVSGEVRQISATAGTAADESVDDRLAARIDPSDVVQEAMMIATQRFPKYLATPPMDFYPWLRQIAWNCLIDLHRRHIQADRRSVDREAPQGISSASATELVDHLLASGTSPLRRDETDVMTQAPYRCEQGGDDDGDAARRPCPTLSAFFQGRHE